MIFDDFCFHQKGKTQTQYDKTPLINIDFNYSKQIK